MSRCFPFWNQRLSVAQQKWITLCESLIFFFFKKQGHMRHLFVLLAICTSIKLDKPRLIPFGRTETGSRCCLTSSSGDQSMKVGLQGCEKSWSSPPCQDTLSPLKDPLAVQWLANSSTFAGRNADFPIANIQSPQIPFYLQDNNEIRASDHVTIL